MPTDNTTPSAADASQALDQIAVWQRGIDAAATLTRFALSQQQVSAELDRAIAEKRATLADDNAKLIADATAAAGQMRDKIVSEAQARADALVLEANNKVADATAAVVQKAAELDALQQQADALRQQLRALAGA
jgi:hypothetical protein